MSLRSTSIFLCIFALALFLITACAPPPSGPGPGGQGPVFAITSPPRDGVIGGTIFFAVDLADPSEVASVQFRAGGTTLAADLPNETMTRVFLMPSDYPAGELELSVVVTGNDGRSRTETRTVEVLGALEEQILVGSNGGVAGTPESVTGGTSVLTVPAGASQGATLSFEARTEAQIEALSGVDYKALGVTFLGAQEIESTEPIDFPLIVASGGFGPRAKSGEAVVNYIIGPDADGDGNGELIVVNTATVAAGEVISDPPSAAFLDADGAVLSRARAPERFSIRQAATSVMPGDVIRVGGSGYNLYSLADNIAVFYSPSTDTYTFTAPLVIPDENDASKQRLFVPVPVLPPGSAEMAIVNLQSQSVTASTELTVNAMPPLPGTIEQAFRSYFGRLRSDFEQLDAFLSPEELDALLQKAHQAEEAYVDLAEQTAILDDPDLTAVVEELAQYLQNSDTDIATAAVAMSQFATQCGDFPVDEAVGTGFATIGLIAAIAGGPVGLGIGLAAGVGSLAYNYWAADQPDATSASADAAGIYLGIDTAINAVDVGNDAARLAAQTSAHNALSFGGTAIAGIGFLYNGAVFSDALGDYLDECDEPGSDDDDSPSPPPGPGPGGGGGGGGGAGGPFLTGMGSILPSGGPVGGSGGGGGGGGPSLRSQQAGSESLAGRYLIVVYINGTTKLPFTGSTGPGGYFFLPYLPSDQPYTAVALDTVTSETRTIEGVAAPGNGVNHMFFDFTPANDPPRADAGVNFGAGLGGQAALDGSASSDPDGDYLTYAWKITSAPGGSSAEISQGSAAEAFFVPDVVGTYQLELTVTDFELVDTDTVTIVVSEGGPVNNPPTANAGADRSVPVGVAETLDGSSSSDPDSDILTFAWTLLSSPAGSAATIAAPASAVTTFTPDVAGAYQVTLTVSDGVLSDSDTVTLTASGTGGACSGSYTIEGPTAQDDLAAIVGCQTVSGNLTINDGVFTAVDLPNLRSVGGDLSVNFVSLLTSLSLPSLESTGGKLLIASNNALASMTLGPVHTVGEFFFSGNPLITNLSVPTLDSIGGRLVISSNAGLDTVTLGAIDTLPGDFTFSGNPQMTTIPLAAGLTEVQGSLSISGNAALTSLDLSALTQSGSLSISNNGALTGVALGALTSTAGLNVSANTALTALSLPQLTTNNGQLTVYSNFALTTLSLASLATVTHNLSVGNNPLLTSFALPAGLTSLGGGADISSNNLLATVQISSLTNVTGSLVLRLNPLLTNLDLSNLATVGGNILITSNAVLATLDIGALQSVGTELQVGSNVLTALAAPNLTSIGSHLTIQSEPAIPVVEFNALTGLGGDVTLTQNDTVTRLTLPGLTGFGNLRISGNASFTTLELPLLTALGGSFNVSDNAVLTALALPPNLGDLGSELRVTDNPLLITLDLTPLANVGFIAIERLGITSLTLPNAITTATTITFTDLTSLTTLDVDQLASVGFFELNGATSLTGLALPNLQSNSGWLRIKNNTLLTSVDLSALTTMGSFELTGNAVITGVTLPAVTSGAAVNAAGNPLLTTLSLPVLASLTQGVTLGSNGVLTAPDFSSLTGMGGRLQIVGSSLVNLDAFAALTGAGSVEIVGNNALTNIDGLSSVGPTTFETIRNNTVFDCTPYNSLPYALPFFPVSSSSGNLVNCVTN